MKKYVLMTIAVLLIIAAIFYAPENVKSFVVAGAGDGENFNIENPDTFKEVMDYFMGEGTSSGTSAEEGAGSLSDSKRPTVHTSGTLEEKSSASVTQNATLNGVSYKSTVAMNRMLTAYMDGDKSYYKSKGMLRTAYDTREHNNVESTVNKMVWDLEMLVDGSELYLKFNTFSVVTDGIAQVNFSPIIGKWVQFPDAYTDQLLTLLEVANRQSLVTVQNLINSGLDDLEPKGDIYYTSFSAYGKDDAEMTLNLSDRDSSILSISINTESVDEDHVLSFYNIDNTEIDVVSTDVIMLTEELVEQMFGGE